MSCSHESEFIKRWGNSRPDGKNRLLFYFDKLAALLLLFWSRKEKAFGEKTWRKKVEKKNFSFLFFFKNELSSHFHANVLLAAFSPSPPSSPFKPQGGRKKGERRERKSKIYPQNPCSRKDFPLLLLLLQCRPCLVSTTLKRATAK